MIILDKVLEACHSDGVLVELGTIEGHWVLAMYDDLGGDMKTYEAETAARSDYTDFKNGKLQFNSLFGFAAQGANNMPHTMYETSMSL